MEMNESKNLELIAKIEALLFSYGDAIEIKKISKVLGAKEDEVKNALNDLEENLKSENRGLRIIKSDEKFQLATKPEFYSILEGMIKDEFKEQLSPASLETLALVAYIGPLSRPQIDYYRGVNSNFILRSLLMRGLVEKFPDPERATVSLYRASFDLIKYLGLSNLSELPEYESFRDILKSGLEEKKENSEPTQNITE